MTLTLKSFLNLFELQSYFFIGIAFFQPQYNLYKFSNWSLIYYADSVLKITGSVVMVMT